MDKKKASELIGTRVGNYEVESLLGKGGMGEVYLAKHPVLGRQVAIKLLARALSDSEELVERFKREAQAVNRIGHEAIVEVTDFGVLENGRSYYVMEYLKGKALQQYLDEKKKLPLAEAKEIMVPVMEALAAAHQAGIIHRDIKPDNIFLTYDRDGRLKPKVLDFGIAKLTDVGTGSGVATRTGALMGTPLFMSPEQAAGATRNIGAWSDVYSLAAVLYTMLAGDPPFPGEAFGEILLHHMQTPPPSVTNVRGDIPPALDMVIRKAMAKAPSDRYPSMSAFKTDFLSALAAQAAVQATIRPQKELALQATQLGTPVPAGGGPIPTPPSSWQNNVSAPASAVPSYPPQTQPPPAGTQPPVGAQGSFPPQTGPGTYPPPQAVPGTYPPPQTGPTQPPHPGSSFGSSQASIPAGRSLESIPGSTRSEGWSSIGASSDSVALLPQTTAAPAGSGVKTGLLIGVLILLVAGLGAGGYFLLKDRFSDKKTKRSGASSKEPSPSRKGPEEPKTPKSPSLNRWVTVSRPQRPVLLMMKEEDGREDEYFFRESAKITCCDASFQIQEHEVTWAEYRRWAKGHKDRSFPRPAHFAADSAATDRLPVTGIPWKLAQAYCRSQGGSLPSEAEWEYTARGPSLRLNPWGDTPADPLTTALLSGARPKLKPVCTSGQDKIAFDGKKICDLAANALEWTQSAFVHPYNPSNPPKAFPYSGSRAALWRSVRGLPPRGQLKSRLPHASTFRSPGCMERSTCIQPDDLLRFDYTGFRCVRSISKEPAGKLEVRGSGSLPPSVIKTRIREQIILVQRCYLSARLTEKNLQGKVTIRFTVNKQGGVKDVKIASSSLRHPTVHHCIRKAVLQWRFPPPEGGGELVIDWPLVFKPK